MAKPDGQILARWQIRLNGTACSPLEFFESVQASVMEKELPNISFSQITRREGRWLSPKRIYLRISCQKLFFDVSAFVAGHCLVVGWWLHKDPPGVGDLFSELPGIGSLLEKTTRASYYSVDFIEHLQRTIHESILQVADAISVENESAPVPDEIWQPVWDEIW